MRDRAFPANRNGAPLFGRLTTVPHHDLHHEDGCWNLGLHFTWWDRLCGTGHPDYRARFRTALGRAALPVLLLVAAAGAPGGAWVAELTGGWAHRGLSFVVRFDPCADDATEICGTLVHVWDRRDARAVPVGGVVMRARRRGGADWSGRFTDPATGAVHAGHLRLLDAGRLQVRLCTGTVCTARTWRSTRWLKAMSRPAQSGP